MKDIILISELIVIRKINHNKLKGVARQCECLNKKEGMASSNGIRSSRMFYSFRCPRGQIMSYTIGFISILNSLTQKKIKIKKPVSRPWSTRKDRN
jgi:hypothetical protein